MYSVKQFLLIEDKYESLTTRSKNFLDDCFDLYYPSDPSPISYCPADIIRYIGYFLSIRNILNLQQTCKFFRKSLTEQIFLSELARLRLTEYDGKLTGCAHILKEIYSVKKDGYKIAAKKGYEKYVIKYFKSEDFALDLFRYMLNPMPPTLEALIIGIKNKHLNLVQSIVENYKILVISQIIVNALVDSDDIDITEYMFSKYQINHDIINDGLMSAAYKNRINIARCLLNHGADVHYRENQVLFVFIRECNLDAVKYLIRLMHATIGLLNEALSTAFTSSNLEIIQHLISLGADVRSLDGSDIMSAIEPQRVHIFKYLVSLGLNLHVGENLMSGILQEETVDVQLFDYFIEQNVPVDLEDNAAIVHSAYEGNMHIFETLIAHGADIRAQDGKCMKNACKKGHLAIVKYLVEHEAGFQIYNHIHLKKAAKNDHLDIIKYLAEQDRNIFLQAGEALIAATDYDHFPIVRYLVQLGANINIQDDEVLMKAVSNGSYDVIKYLLNPAYEDKYKYCYGYHQSYRKLSTIRSNINARNSAALVIAISLKTIYICEGHAELATEDNRLKIVELLVAGPSGLERTPNNLKGIIITDDALELAVKTNQLKILKYLLSKRKNITLIYDKLFDVAIKSKFQDIINYFIMNDPNNRYQQLSDNYKIKKLSIRPSSTEIPPEITYIPDNVLNDINS